jgi:hypothetical protein
VTSGKRPEKTVRVRFAVEKNPWGLFPSPEVLGP